MSEHTPHLHPNVSRSLTTLECGEVDRAPRYLPAISCGVASAMLGKAVNTGTGSLHYAEVAAWADGEAAHAEFEGRLDENIVEIHRVLDVDVLRMPWRMNARPDARIDDYTFRFGPESGEHSIWQYQPATADFSACYHSPRESAPEERMRSEVAQLEEAMSDPMPAARAEVAPVLELWKRHGTEFYVIGSGAHIGVGLEPEDLELMILEPELLRRKCLLQADFAIAVGQALVESGCPPVICGGGDLAGNNGPFYSPKMFRDLVLPGYVKALTELNRLGVHYFFRTDGNIDLLMDMIFAEAACPGYGETDRDAAMTVASVRARFPKMVIWGNVSSNLLALGTAAQVREQAQATLAESGGRGYFQGCSNALVQGTPPENVSAMYEVC